MPREFERLHFGLGEICKVCGVPVARCARTQASPVEPARAQHTRPARTHTRADTHSRAAEQTRAHPHARCWPATTIRLCACSRRGWCRAQRQVMGGRFREERAGVRPCASPQNAPLPCGPTRVMGGSLMRRGGPRHRFAWLLLRSQLFLPRFAA